MNLNEFGAWALSKKSVANPVGTYKGQCVSLIQQYLYRVFGKPFKSYGNAKDWANNYPKDYFVKLSANVKLQPGDVLVYGKNYGKGFGHIALIDVNGKYFDQNGLKKLAVAYRDKPFSGYICVLRPKNQDKLGISKNRFNVGSLYTTQTNLKIRLGAGTKYPTVPRSSMTVNARKNLTITGSLKKGTRVTCQQVKNVGNNIWIKIPSGWVAAYYNGKEYIK